MTNTTNQPKCFIITNEDHEYYMGIIVQEEDGRYYNEMGEEFVEGLDESNTKEITLDQYNEAFDICEHEGYDTYLDLVTKWV